MELVVRPAVGLVVRLAVGRVVNATVGSVARSADARPGGKGQWPGWW